MNRVISILALLIAFSANSQGESGEKKDYEVLWQIEQVDTMSIEYQNAINESNKGLSAFLQLDYDRAILHFDSAIRLSPRTPKFYANRGGVYYEQGRYLKALNDYDTCVNLDAANPNYLYNRGLARKDLGQYLLAISDFESSLSIHPNNSFAHTYLGICYANSGDLELALKSFNEAINQDSTIAEFYYNRSVHFSSIGNADAKKKDLEMAIKLNPNYSYALNNLGYHYLNHENNYEKAIEYFTLTIATEYNANAYFNRAQAFSYLKEYDKAIQDLNFLIAKEGEDRQLISSRVRLYMLNGEREKAERDIEKLEKLEKR